nr:iron-containing alcohol dehydrogenase [uncultured Acetobacterium sp.]
MANFVFQNTTKIYFGNEQLVHLGEEIKKYGSHVLLAYGEGSIKNNGLYDNIIKVLNDAGVEITEFQGIEPNPQYSTVNRAAELCRKNNCDVVLGVGGGSVIDAAKVIAQANYYDGDCWDLITQKVAVDQSLPLITIVTMASAGSENDAWAVISNKDENVKLDPWGKNYQPTLSFVNPEITYSVGAYQTAVGAADTLSHITDCRYFIKEHKIEFVNEMMEVMAANVIKYGPIAVKDPTNAEARENLSWISTMITGGIMDVGGKTDMVLHLTEYGIAAFYEIPHGHGIAILMPRWMSYVLDEQTAPDFYRFGVKCFNIDASLDAMEGAKQTIATLSDWFYVTLNLQSQLSDFGVTADRLHDMAIKACERTGGTLNSITTLTVEDVENIFKLCL